MTTPVDASTNTTPFLTTLRVPGSGEVVVEILGDGEGDYEASVVLPSSLDFFHASAETVGDTLGRLVAAIVETRDHLAANEERLGPLPRRQLRAIRMLEEPTLRQCRRSDTPPLAVRPQSASNDHKLAL